MPPEVGDGLRPARPGTGRYTLGMEQPTAASINDPATIVIVLSILIIAVAVVRRIVEHIAPTGRTFLIAEYAPPRDLNVMVAAHLVGRPSGAVPAQLLQLAIGKNLRILDRSMRRGRHGYAVQYLTSEGADEIGAQMLLAVFGAAPVEGMVRELRASNLAIRYNVGTVSAHAFSEAKRRGWRRPVSVLQWLNLVGAGLLEAWVLVSAVWFFLTSQSSSLWVVAFLAAPIALAVAIISLRLYGGLTDEGAQVRDHLVGLRIYLELAEEDRLAMLQGAITAERQAGRGAAVIIRVYEKLLPYAVVWRVERSWISELIGDAIDLDRAPNWVADLNQLSFIGFRIALDRFRASLVGTLGQFRSVDNRPPTRSAHRAMSDRTEL